MRNYNNLFSIKSIYLHIILIGAIIGLYYFLYTQGLFPQWIDYIYSAGKGLIAFIIILGSARSAMMPLLTLFSGLAILLTNQYGIPIVSYVNAWELLIMALIGLIITILVRW
ncbi:MAG: hypothetical protein K0S27_630 [Gammaproteobacteria bacterium]|jgi:hypothetical protein|nr:hypothetical protein [Gammaproteobacteria bacterium]